MAETADVPVGDVTISKIVDTRRVDNSAGSVKFDVTIKATSYNSNIINLHLVFIFAESACTDDSPYSASSINVSSMIKSRGGDFYRHLDDDAAAAAAAAAGCRTCFVGE